MKAAAETPDVYVAAIDAERRPHIEALRALVKKTVPEADESIVWGMLGFSYQGRPFAALAAHKTTLSLYLMDLYTQPGLRERHEKALSKLKIGKSCINFQTVSELPRETIAAILAEAPKFKVASGTLAAKAKTKKPAKKR